MTDTINILCATDDNYVPFCGIMLTSLLMNNQDERVHIFIMVEKELTTGNKNRFARLIAPYNATIDYVIVNKSLFERYPTQNMEYWSLAMYYRILAADLLPEDIEKVLYLDCDIIVTTTLRQVYDTDVTDKALGVVPDIFLSDDEIYDRLNYQREYGYFNSGVLLMNLKYWREHKSVDACFKYLSSHYDKLRANDQDLLNAVLHKQNIVMPLTCNYQIQFLAKYFFEKLKEYQHDIISTHKEVPIIIHYASPIKPWQILYYKMPYKQLWNYYKRKSQWWYLLPQMPKKKTINYLIKRFLLWPLGIMHKKQYIY